MDDLSEKLSGILNDPEAMRDIAALASQLGITPDEIVCIGDEENDISMFEVIGHPYAMGNAIDKLKSLAEKVLPTNDEDGVAFAVNEILGGNL